MDEQYGEPVASSMAGSMTSAPTTSAAGVDPTPAVRQLHEVDAALAGLSELPVGDQVAVFTDLHGRLAAALAVTATAGAADESGPPPHRGR